MPSGFHGGVVMKVRLTFEKNNKDEHAVFRKEGGFSPKDREQLTNIIEDLFGDGGAEDSVADQEELEEEGDENTEETDGDKSFQDRVARQAKEAVAQAKQAGNGGGSKPQVTPPAGRGAVQAKTAEGVGITKDGTVDRRTLRGSPEASDPKQQKVAKAVESASEADA